MRIPASRRARIRSDRRIRRGLRAGGGTATKVALIAGSMSMTDVNHFSTGWHPATTRSITLTVPDSLKPALGGGSGNYIFVKVAQSNSTASSPTKYLHYDYASKYVL